MIILPIRKLNILFKGFKANTVNIKLLKTMASKRCDYDEGTILNLTKQIVPKLTLSKRKGQYGRVALIGGSLEYTGAPYFAAISALKVGADLVHVFCVREAAVAIKSYSPELIVHPLLDVDDGISKISEWLNRFDVVIVGPGLGRNETIMKTVEQIITKCRELNIPLVIDADGLFLVTNKIDVIKNYPLVVLTPNAIEFSRLFNIPVDTEIDLEQIKINLKAIGENIIIVKKEREDIIFDSNQSVKCTAMGSGRRCGGQGDLLSGSLGTFMAWAMRAEINQEKNLKAMSAAYGACRLTRECNAGGFALYGRSMTTSDMIKQIHNSFEKIFGE